MRRALAWLLMAVLGTLFICGVMTYCDADNVLRDTGRVPGRL